MQKVLILIENARAVIAELRSLSKMEDLEIHIAVNKKVFSNKIRFLSYIQSDKYYEYGDIKNSISFLNEIVKRIGPFILLPNGEEVLREIVKHKYSLIASGIKLSLPDESTYKLLSDKFTFAETCVKFGIPVPETIENPTGKYINQIVVKPKVLEDSLRVLKVPLLIENENSFQNFINLKLDLDKHFIQKLIIGPSYYYCASYEKGKKKAWFAQKNLHQQPGGKSIIKAIPFNLPNGYIEKIDAMMSKYCWDGIMMFELKEHLETKQLFAIECNPRFWGPLQLAVDNNIDFVKSLIDPDYYCLTPPNMKKGYLWRAGYFHGFFLKKRSKTSFQKFVQDDELIKYKDIWGRNDSFIYYLIEPVIILLKEVRRLLVNNQK